jgi:hypothetical protein
VFFHWVAMGLPSRFDSRAAARRGEGRDGFYDHAPAPGAAGRAQWHVRPAGQGRPHGLYGNAFARTDAETVRRATTRIDPPTIANLIAMAAPAEGYGRYGAPIIEHILTTAFTGFRAAALESAWHHGDRRPVLVHTGGPGGADALRTAIDQIDSKLATAPAVETHDLIAQVTALSFEWGVSDGN